MSATSRTRCCACETAIPYPGTKTTDREVPNSSAASSTEHCRMGFLPSSSAGLSCTLPKAPNSTLVIERFIARHMRMERMKPDDPSSEPVMIWILLSSMKPIAASVRPA